MGGGGKGGKQQTVQDTSGTSNTSGTSQTQLPSWLTGAAQQAVGTAQTLSQDPNLFNPYPGQQVADVSPGTQQGWNYGVNTDPYQMASNIGGATNDVYNTIASLGAGSQQAIANGLNSATGAYTSGLQNAQTSENNGLSAAQGLLGGWAGIGPISAQQIAQNAQSMMSPYTQAVIDPTMALGKQALQQQLQTVGAQANQAGAFGGARQGVQEGVAQAQSALQESNVLGQMLNTGYNTSLTAANQLGMQTQQLGENAASTLGQMYGSAGQQMAGLYGTAGNTLAQLQAQAGGQLGGYNQADINNALTTGSGLPQQYLQNLLGIGGLQQSQQQAGLNAQMGNYYGMQQQPIQNLDLLLSAVTGVPYGTSTAATGTGATTGTGTTTATTTPSTVDQIGSYLGLISKVASVAGGV